MTLPGRVVVFLKFQSRKGTYVLRNDAFRLESVPVEWRERSEDEAINIKIERHSPDKKFRAVASGHRHASVPDYVAIVDVPEEREVAAFDLKPAWVEDMAWSPTGYFLALLVETERYERGPLGSFWRVMGHPVPHDRFYLDVRTVRGDVVLRVPVGASGKYGEGEVTWKGRG